MSPHVLPTIFDVEALAALRDNRGLESEVTGAVRIARCETTSLTGSRRIRSPRLSDAGPGRTALPFSGDCNKTVTPLCLRPSVLHGEAVALCRSGSAHFRGFPFDRRRTPGPPPFWSMNSTPPSSSALRIAASVRSFSSSPRSNLATVSTDTFAAAARSRTPRPRAARAIRHWTGKKIITLLRFPLKSVICTDIGSLF